ncbi:anthranilate synthase alpha subunit 1, chloroplastic-like isoform X2 [Lotus japonicus]|uniref:anthranilate synthase alpha subunit 1, chloroplastic-like isoform X2 n=1 Tax=Lotus japonicus TaxID=34305 RepID=UPI0025845B9C|nr:anthranilate synthase alpha subunit 1, chloroplastic-like isoform X2 [Lotus japonicus]XP_057416383.1 anthranilate synthase alpha subunit 1, chloroplastic-like isoform X2 [Lotus japonicus]
MLSANASTTQDLAFSRCIAPSGTRLYPPRLTRVSLSVTRAATLRCSALPRLAHDDQEAPSFLFESAEPNFQSTNVGRYSVVGAQPTVEVVAKENKVTIMGHESGHLTEETVDDPMTVPRRISEGWKPYLTDELPDAFSVRLMADGGLWRKAINRSHLSLTNSGGVDGFWQHMAEYWPSCYC